MQLYCTSTEQDQHLVQHDVPVAAACELVPDPVQGHQHGPSCGHEFILHNDHYDYLVRRLPMLPHQHVLAAVNGTLDATAATAAAFSFFVNATLNSRYHIGQTCRCLLACAVMPRRS